MKTIPFYLRRFAQSDDHSQVDEMLPVWDISHKVENEVELRLDGSVYRPVDAAEERRNRMLSEIARRNGLGHW
jgi:hypothetical protein